MENERAKLFVGGISKETSEENLRAHFKKYGTVLSSSVAKDKTTRVPRGFGFVLFSDTLSADLALRDSHVILGRTVDVKKAVPRSEQHQQFQLQQQQQPPSREQHQQYQHGNNGVGYFNGDGGSNDCFRNKKVFVGGLPASLTQGQFKNYFERFGNIVDVVVMQDSLTNRPRGFGFVTFDSEESVDRVMVNTRHELNGRSVEVKRAVPKDEINSKSSSYFSRGAVRGSFEGISQAGMFSPYGPRFEVPSNYTSFPGYSGLGGYFYGTDAYGNGYSMVEYNRTGYGVTPMVPRSPWSGAVMVGPGICALPYNNACLYPAYINSGVTTGLYNGAVVPCLNGNLNQVPVGNGHLPSDGTPSSDQGMNWQAGAAGSKQCGAST